MAADRASERLTTEQTTPSDFTQGSAQWVGAFGSHSFIVGGEFQDTDATVEEFRYSLTNVQTGPFLVGGDALLMGGFLRGRFALGEAWTLSAGARVDGWKTSSIDPAVPIAPRRSSARASPWPGSAAGSAPMSPPRAPIARRR